MNSAFRVFHRDSSFKWLERAKASSEVRWPPSRAVPVAPFVSSRAALHICSAGSHVLPMKMRTTQSRTR